MPKFNKEEMLYRARLSEVKDKKEFIVKTPREGKTIDPLWTFLFYKNVDTKKEEV